MCLCRLLLHTHIEQILCRTESALAAHTDHAHTQKAGHGAGGVAGSSLHGVGGGICHASCHHERVGAHVGGIFQLVDLLHVGVGQRDGVERNFTNRNAAVVDPLLLQHLIHCRFQFFCFRRNLCRAKLLFRQRAESRLQSVDEFRFELVVDLLAGKLALHIAAKPCVEQQRIGDHIGIHAVAAHLHSAADTDALVYHFKYDRAGRTEFVVQNFFGVEIIYPLILAGVAAVSETLADGLKRILDAFAQTACKDRRLGGSVVCKFTGFGADLHDLALFHDDHALTVRHGNSGTVGDDVIVPFCVGGTPANTLFPLAHQYIVGQCFAVKEFLPLIGQCAAQCADSRFN